jgi:hypothetical protein
LLLSSFGYSADLRAHRDLNPSLIDNRYDIPVGIPIVTSTSILPPYPRADPQNKGYSSDLGPGTANIIQLPAVDIWSISSGGTLFHKSQISAGSST